MVGYGKEEDHFVVELTYNYGIKNYVKGNDFQVPLLIVTYHVISLHNSGMVPTEDCRIFQRGAGESSQGELCTEEGV